MKLFILKLALFIAAALVFKNVRAESEKNEVGTDAIGLERRTLFTQLPLEAAAKRNVIGDSTALLETDLTNARMQVEVRGKKRSRGGKKRSRGGKKRSRGGKKRSRRSSRRSRGKVRRRRGRRSSRRSRRSSISGRGLPSPLVKQWQLGRHRQYSTPYATRLRESSEFVLSLTMSHSLSWDWIA